MSKSRELDRMKKYKRRRKEQKKVCGMTKNRVGVKMRNRKVPKSIFLKQRKGVHKEHCKAIEKKRIWELFNAYTYFSSNL